MDTKATSDPERPGMGLYVNELRKVQNNMDNTAMALMDVAFHIDHVLQSLFEQDEEEEIANRIFEC